MRVLVLGASEKTNRYSNMAIRMLRDYEHEVVAVGNRVGQVLDVPIEKVSDPHSDVHTITLSYTFYEIDLPEGYASLDVQAQTNTN